MTGDAQLTRREREVWHLYLEGHATKEIAARLCIDRTTVAYHKMTLMRKLGCRNFVELIKCGIRNGLTTP